MGAFDRARAIRELEALHAERPEFPVASMVLASLCLDEGQPDRALELARDLSTKVSRNDVASHTLAARALRQLGRTDEAMTASNYARSLVPNDGPSLAIAAQLALDCGDIDEASRLLAQADENNPGHPTIRLAQAELAVACGSEPEATEMLGAAREAIRLHPLLFLDRELDRLECRASELPGRIETTVHPTA